MLILTTGKLLISQQAHKDRSLAQTRDNIRTKLSATQRDLLEKIMQNKQQANFHSSLVRSRDNLTRKKGLVCDLFSSFGS